MGKELLVTCGSCPGAHPANAGACAPAGSPCFSVTAFTNVGGLVAEQRYKDAVLKICELQSLLLEIDVASRHRTITIVPAEARGDGVLERVRREVESYAGGAPITRRNSSCLS